MKAKPNSLGGDADQSIGKLFIGHHEIVTDGGGGDGSRALQKAGEGGSAGCRAWRYQRRNCHVN